MRNPLTVFQLVKSYDQSNLKSDLMAGLSTGMLLIPQAMAYAVIAGVPVQYGLYAAFIAPLIYLIFGSANKLVLGPAALDSMLISSSLAIVAVGFSEEKYISYVLATALLTGIFQIVFSFLKLGFISNFFSKPLLTGFTSAAAILIAFSQLKNVFGVDITRTSLFHEYIFNCFSVIKNISIPATILGIATILLIQLFKKLGLTKVATPIVVIIGIILNYIFNLSDYGIKTIDSIPNGFPQFLPFEISTIDWLDIITPALVLALIGFTISMSISKVTEDNPSKIRSNQELFALGIANISSSIFGGYQASSSFSRTAINKASGAKTRISNLSSSLIILLVLLFFTDIFELLPMAILGAIIISAMPSLIKFKEFRSTFQLEKREFIVLISTFLVTLEFGVVLGFGVGVLVSGGVFLFHTLQPHIAVLGQIEDTDIFKNVNRFNNAHESNDTLIIRVDGSIYFANVKYILSSISKKLKERKGIKHLIIHSESINYIDITAFGELQEFILKSKSNGIQTYLSAVQGPIRDLFRLHKFDKNLGGGTLFLNLPETLGYIERGIVTNHDIANQSSEQ